MSFDAPRPETRLAVVGMTGTGKSTRVKAAIKSWLASGVRVVALDVCDEYSRMGVDRGGLTSHGPLKNRVTAMELAQGKGKQLLDARLSLAVVPDNRNDPRSHAAAFLLLYKMLLRVSSPTRRVVLVVDETAWWTNSSTGTKCHEARINLEALAATGRKEGIALVTVSQSASGIPPVVRKQSNEWWLFTQHDPADLEAVKDRFDEHTANEVKALPPYSLVQKRGASITQHNKPALKAV